MHKLKTFLEQTPLFLLLLPIFFFLHDLIDNFHYSLTKEAALLTLQYIGFSLLIAAFFWLFTKNFFKACIPATIAMAFNLFFGSIYDTIKTSFGELFLMRYSVVIPFVILLLLLTTIYFMTWYTIPKKPYF